MPDVLLPLPGPQAQTTEVCVVLVDVVGSTALAHRLPLSHYTAVMAEFVQVAMLGFEAAGGEVLQHQGDAVLAIWPAGRAEQACGAVQGAHDGASRLKLPAALGFRLELHAGLACGEVITGVVGGQASAYGLPVNLARRLCDAAAPGETLVCAGTAGQLRHPLRSPLSRSLTLRGFPPGCEAYPLRPAAWARPLPLSMQMKVD